MKKLYVKPELIKRAKLSFITGAPAASGPPPVISDIRLKTDIEQVGVASNGLPLYNFRYLWSEAVYQGVMAQDVLKAFPDAVHTTSDGFLAVKYDMIGMKMVRVH